MILCLGFTNAVMLSDFIHHIKLVVHGGNLSLNLEAYTVC